MNINNGIKDEELSAALAACEDESSHHVLWADHDGEVWITPVPIGETPIGLERQTPSMKVRWPSWAAGCGYCGQEAARDPKYVSCLNRDIRDGWLNSPRHPGRPYYAGC